MSVSDGQKTPISRHRPRHARTSREPVNDPPLSVPPAVKDIAQAIALRPEIADRLMSHPDMQSVWTWLRQRAQKLHKRGDLEKRLRNLPERWLLHNWGLSERLGPSPFEQGAALWGFSERYASLPDHACAAFCACVVITLGVNNPAVTRAGIEAQIRERRRVAGLLSRETALPGRAQLDPELTAHLSAASAYFEEDTDFLETSAPLSRAYYLGRSSKKRGNDNVRAHARAIAIGARAIFGEFLYGIVATVMSVALQINVSDGNVRDWCADLHLHGLDSPE